MVRAHESFELSVEEFLAELTAVAYRVALRHGLRTPFIDVELDLWRELRAVLRRELYGSPRPAAAAAPKRAHREEAAPCLR